MSTVKHPPRVKIHKTSDGEWNVYVRGNWINAYSTRQEARVVARELARCEP